jgi:hypothetical protein
MRNSSLCFEIKSKSCVSRSVFLKKCVLFPEFCNFCCRIIVVLCLLQLLDSFFLSSSLFYLLVHSRCRGFLWLHLITLRHTPHSVGLLWTRDRPFAETSTWQHKHCTRHTSMPPVGFEPRSQQAFGRRPTPYTARPLGSAITVLRENFWVASESWPCGITSQNEMCGCGGHHRN